MKPRIHPAKAIKKVEVNLVLQGNAIAYLRILAARLKGSFVNRRIVIAGQAH